MGKSVNLHNPHALLIVQYDGLKTINMPLVHGELRYPQHTRKISAVTCCMTLKTLGQTLVVKVQNQRGHPTLALSLALPIPWLLVSGELVLRQLHRTLVQLNLLSCLLTATGQMHGGLWSVIALR